MLSKIFTDPKNDFRNFPVVNAEFSEFEINNWILSEFIINGLYHLVGIHPYPLNELLLMTGTLCRLHPDHLFEWGTHTGKSARIFLETCKRFNLKTIIHSIDLPASALHEEHPGRDYAKLLRGTRGVKLYRGDGLEIAARLAKSIDPSASLMFFLDGDHSFESVAHELETVTVSFPAASVLIHDTFYQDPGCGYNIGPYKAIQHLLSKTPSGYRLIETRTGLPGMSLLIPA